MTRARILADYVSGGTTAAEFDYLDGVTSNVQTQLDAKVSNATHTGDVTGGTALTIATDAVDIAMLSATGTASATTYLRGDNAWEAAGGGGVVKVTYFTPASFDVATYNPSTPSESSSIAITMTSGNRILLTWSGCLYMSKTNDQNHCHMGVTGTNMDSAASAVLESAQCHFVKASNLRLGDGVGLDTYLNASTTILCPVVNATSASYNIFMKGGNLVGASTMGCYFGRQAVVAQEIDISVIT